MKNGCLLAIAAFCWFFLGCSEPNSTPEILPPNPSPPVLLSRENPIYFTAGASEAFEVEVTTSLEWEVVSDKAWCVATKVESRASAQKFTVTASPNTSGIAPERATITVIAGGKSYAALTVTQAAALLEYPTDIKAFEAAVYKTWIFESGEYSALLLSGAGYSLIPRELNVRSSADAAPVPVVSGGFYIDRDLRTIVLRDDKFFDFATLKFIELTDESAKMEFTPRDWNT